MQESQDSFQLPVFVRKMENLHIIFWLLKDMSWAMGWKIVGICMIAPTLLYSYRFTCRHNFAKTQRNGTTTMLSFAG